MNTTKCRIQQPVLAKLTGPKGKLTLLASPKCSQYLQIVGILEVDDVSYDADHFCRWYIQCVRKTEQQEIRNNPLCLHVDLIFYKTLCIWENKVQKCQEVSQFKATQVEMAEEEWKLVTYDSRFHLSATLYFKSITQCLRICLCLNMCTISMFISPGRWLFLLNLVTPLYSEILRFRAGALQMRA